MQVQYAISADTASSARRIAEAQARSHGWRNINVLFVREQAYRSYLVTLNVS